MINLYQRRKKPVTIERIDPFHRILLENRSLTTILLEQLTGSVVAVDPCTRVRRKSAVRFSVLTGGGVVFVFARSAVNLSLLPEAAVNAVLQGKKPLGRIFAGHVRDNQRCNFSYFTIEDERLTPVMYGCLADSATAVRQHKKKRQDIREFPGRSYDIYAGKRKIAHIEEIFSPLIREKAVERRLLTGSANYPQTGRLLCREPFYQVDSTAMVCG